MGVLLVRQLWWLTNLLCFSRNLAFAFADSEPHGDPPQQTCGAYKGSTCDTILMSTVMTETTGMFCLRCVVAATLGGVIGAQREFSPYIGMFLLRAKHTAVAPVRRAGLRTYVLVALGACLFTEASWSAFAVAVPTQIGTGDGTNQGTPFVAGTFNYDSARVAAQVVSGVGFLGAGTIWRSSFGAGGGGGGRCTVRDEVFGLTTAASLWATAAVGMHVGGANQKDSYYLGPLFATFLIVVTLQILVHVEIVAHEFAFARTTTKISGNVTVVVTHSAEHTTASTAILAKVVDVVTNRVGKVVTIGASVDNDSVGRPYSIQCSLVVVVPAAGGSLELMDALLTLQGVPECRVTNCSVDNCGPQPKGKKKEQRVTMHTSIGNDSETLAEPLLHQTNGTC